MKKKIVLATILVLMLFTGAVAATSMNGDYKGMPIVKVNVDGKEIQPEVPAHILDGSTMLPLRAVSEALGAEVTWDPSQYTASVKMPKLSAPGLSLAQLNKIGESVGIVFVYDDAGNYKGQGAGFLLADGVFVTNYHVGAAGTKLRIDINGKSYNTNGESLFKNADADVFAVRINETNSLTYTTELPKYGARVYSLGFPHGKFQINEGTVLVSSPIQITSTARSDSGSSGGILIGDDGRVVGVTSAGAATDKAVDYSESIPMSVVQKELDKLNK